MLKDHDSIATISVKDLNAAKKFYSETLGLEQLHAEGEEAVTYQTGASKLVVYRSQYAGTNKATGCNWNVGAEIDVIVKDLESRKVQFEQYNMPGLKREGNIHTAGSMRVAWFKDPEGNIHSLMNG